MALYADSSALVAILLEGRRELHRLFREHEVVASDLTLLEVQRTITRSVATGRIDPDTAARISRRLVNLLAEVQLYPIDGPVLKRAGQRFPKETVRSLDAIHLATAEAIHREKETVMLSLDVRVRENAEALGLEVLPRAP